MDGEKSLEMLSSGHDTATQRLYSCTRELTAGVTPFKRPRQIKSDSSMDGEGLMRPTPN